LTIVTFINSRRFEVAMPRFHFDIKDGGQLIEDEEGQEFAETDLVRREAVETGASLARDAFIIGKTSKVIVAVRQGDVPFLRVSISLEIEEC
jgi:hypothetical protein